MVDPCMHLSSCRARAIDGSVAWVDKEELMRGDPFSSCVHALRGTCTYLTAMDLLFCFSTSGTFDTLDTRT